MVENVITLQTYLDSGKITFINDPTNVRSKRDCKYKISSSLRETKESISGWVQSLSDKLVKLMRKTYNLDNKVCRRISDDTLSESFRNMDQYKINKLYTFFDRVNIGLDDGETEFLKIFRASNVGVNKSFYQILGVDIKDDTNLYRLNDAEHEKSLLIIELFEDITEAKFIDFRLFMDLFGRIPYAYFYAATQKIMRVGGYKSYSELFYDAVQSTDIIRKRCHLN